MHADGVGTKLALAYAMAMETGDLSFLRGVAHDGLEMNIGDMMCVGDFSTMLTSNTIGHNGLLVSDVMLGEVFEGRRAYETLMAEHGLDLVSTGGETASVGDLVRTLDLNYTCIGWLDQSEVVDAGRIRPGDLIVGLASYGKATYEDRYNSGIGSNGLTSARHDILNSAVGHKFPETVSPQMPRNLVYRGKHYLTDPCVELGMSYGEALLSPTRTYVPIMKKVFEQVPVQHLHGIIHNTGGGLSKVRRFLTGSRAVKHNLLPVPPIFQIIQHESGTSWQEMYKTYNMGSLLEYYVPEDMAQSIIEIARSFGVEAQIVGYVEPCETGEEVLVRSPNGEFIYK
jgi:phosphoribosylformylglycinamidine cyclo-ligase